MPLVLHKHLPPDLQIAVWKIEESLETLHQMIDWTFEDEKEWQSFKSTPRQKEWLCIRALLQKITGQIAKIEYDVFGKPFLKNYTGSFSITHCQNYAAIAFSPTHSVGIDIEKYSDQVLKIVPRFLNAQELNVLKKSKLAYPELLAWCAKEVLFKIYGKGQVEFKIDLALIFEEDQLVGRIHKENPPIKVRFHFEYQPDFLLVYGMVIS